MYKYMYVCIGKSERVERKRGKGRERGKERGIVRQSGNIRGRKRGIGSTPWAESLGGRMRKGQRETEKEWRRDRES